MVDPVCWVLTIVEGMAMQNNKSGVLAVLYVATIDVVKGDVLRN